MAYIISAVGAGGKTSFLHREAIKYLEAGKTVALTTTTHIFNCDLINKKGYSVVGKAEDNGKLSYPGDTVFDKLCGDFDYVLVEADGSRSMPVKIPRSYEPVIPENSDEIHIIMGTQAVGRKLSEVCQNFVAYSGEDCKVTPEILKFIAEKYYIKPLSKQYPDSKIFYSPTNKPVLPDTGKRKLLMAFLASGFSRRFKGNKLLADYRGKPLFKHMLDELIMVNKSLNGISNILVISTYEDILSAYPDSIRNENAIEGISASIKLATEYAIKNDFTDVGFFLADMPELRKADILDFITSYFYSENEAGCMCTRGFCSNPGILRLNNENAKALLSIEGEQGAMGIIEKNRAKMYRHYLSADKLMDIDSTEDIN